MVNQCSRDPGFVFITGDLGFGALEPLRDAARDRFINAGIAEQNMVSVGAGLAHEGFKPWLYSIAPFVYARPFEQIRNDVCLHNLAVALVGNGGGYGYGVMGATHHALEDYGVLLTLNNLKAFIPAFAHDVQECVNTISSQNIPSYLRLGKCEAPGNFRPPPYAQWRLLMKGDHRQAVFIGPVVGPVIAQYLNRSENDRPTIWSLSELPIRAESLPVDLVECISDGAPLWVFEEHIPHGSAGQMLLYCLHEHGAPPRQFVHTCATGYPTKTYGSQAFHRKGCGLDSAMIMESLSAGR